MAISAAMASLRLAPIVIKPVFFRSFIEVVLQAALQVSLQVVLQDALYGDCVVCVKRQGAIGQQRSRYSRLHDYQNRVCST